MVLPRGPGHKSSLSFFTSIKESGDLVVYAAVMLLQVYFPLVWARNLASTAGPAIKIRCYKADVFICVCFSWCGQK